MPTASIASRHTAEGPKAKAKPQGDWDQRVVLRHYAWTLPANVASTSTLTTPEPGDPLKEAAGATTHAATGPASTATNDTLRFILVALFLSFAMFGVAAIPARVVPWRGAADFIDGRQLDVLLLGVVLLVSTLLAIVVTNW